MATITESGTGRMLPTVLVSLKVTGYNASVAPPVTLTGTLAVPFAAIEKVPLDGLTVIPEGTVAVQSTVCELLLVDLADRVVEPVAPGWITRVDGPTEAVSAKTGP